MPAIPALTLAARTLRMDARSPVKAWLRAALVASLVIALWMAVWRSTWFGAPGLRFFRTLVEIDFWLITLLGIATFSGVITEEKEGMTLGLLRLAGFDRLAILLGKSVGHLLAAIVLLLVQLPFAVLAITLGGVRQSQVFDAFALLLAYLLLVFSLALLASTVCKRSVTAGQVTGLLLFVVLFLPRLLLMLLLLTTGLQAPGGGLPMTLERLLAAWMALSPHDALGAVVGGSAAPELVTSVVLGALVPAGGALLLAWLVFERANLEEWRPAQPRGWIGWSVGARGERARPQPGAAALAWKDYHFLGRGSVGVLGRLLIYVLFIALLWVLTVVLWRSTSPSRFMVLLVPWLLLLFTIDCCHVASHVFHDEAFGKTLPPLVALPLPLRTWVWAKVRGYGLVLVPGAILLAFTVLGAANASSMPPARYVPLIVFCLSAMFAFAVAMSAFLSLLMRRGAIALTAASVFVGQLLMIFLGTTCVSGGSGSAEVYMFLASCTWFLAALASGRAVFQKLVEIGAR